MDNPEALVPITKKIGRPLGSKNKPKWWPKPPKRPVGRPPGAKNKPKGSLSDLLSATLNEAMAEPPVAPKRTRKRKKRKSQIKDPTARKMTAKQRTEKGRAMAKASIGKSGRKSGVPTGWRHQDYALMVDQADKEARELFNQMAKEGLVPEEDMAQAALLEALRIMKNKATPQKLKLAAGRLLLDFTRSKPAAKSDVTIHNAEAFLDALAEHENNETRGT